MNLFDNPFSQERINIPDLNIKLKADFSQTVLPAEKFDSYFQSTVCDVKLSNFRIASPHLMIPVSQCKELIDGRQPSKRTRKTPTMSPLTSTAMDPLTLTGPASIPHPSPATDATNSPRPQSEHLCMPPLGQLVSEEYLAGYLNDIVSTFHCFHSELPQNRPTPLPLGYWTASHHNKLLGAGGYRAKPDIIMIPVQLTDEAKPVPMKVPDDDIAWPDVLCASEMTSTCRWTPSIQNQAISRAYLMLYTQGDRNMAITFALTGNSWYVYLTDREGVITIGPMSYETHTEQFLSLILTISYIPLGLDDDQKRRAYKLPPTAVPLALNSGFKTCLEFVSKHPGSASATPLSPATPFSSVTTHFSQDNLPSVSPSQPSGFSQSLPAQSLTAEMSILSSSLLQEAQSLPKSSLPKSSLPKSSLPKSSIPPSLPETSMPPSPLPCKSKSRKSTKRKHDDPSGQRAENPPATTTEIDANMDGNIDSIHCDGQEFTIIREIFHSPSLVGRATRVWLAEDKNKDQVIIKESWMLQGRRASISKKEENVRPKHRVKHRIVEKPFCSSIATVKSVLELLGAFLDYVKGVKYLRDNNRMHRDISASNVMLYTGGFTEADGGSTEADGGSTEADGGSTEADGRPTVIQILRDAGCSRGILIDLDYATFIDPALPDPLPPAPDANVTPALPDPDPRNKGSTKPTKYEELKGRT
ncbi:hypothetical protein C0991_011355, partial [Blastosporella zonata]